jgi:hypothetical protein
MIHIEFTITRRHLAILAGMLLSGVLLIPGVAWASHQFTDVPDSNIFHADIDWLADAGITLGCNPPANDEYCPNDPVTRGQMAAFMHRLSGSDSSTLDGRLDVLETLLADVSRNGDVLLFTGMNLQVLNGAGTTPTTNGLGNVIVGYNADVADTRTGSHMVVIGDNHTYTSYGGIVAGLDNTTTGAYSSVTGGSENTASGTGSSVSGGFSNTASGPSSSVSGGVLNTASGIYSSVSGGVDNTASGTYSSILGGLNQTVSTTYGIYPS